jgi:hypothetical protein
MDIYDRLDRIRPILQDEGAGMIGPNAIRRINAAYKRLQADPGDAEGDDCLLFGLAVGEEIIGRGAGYIPEVQRVGCRIAALLEEG